MKIEFRGKRLRSSEWVHGFYYEERGFSYITVVTDKPGEIPVHLNVPVRPKTVGQYIELKDVNDKKIFEGDIVKHTYGEYSFIGVITKDRYVFYIKGNTDNFDLEDVSNTVDGTTSLQVIGNIHDNPEFSAWGLREGAK